METVNNNKTIPSSLTLDLTMNFYYKFINFYGGKNV